MKKINNYLRPLFLVIISLFPFLSAHGEYTKVEFPADEYTIEGITYSRLGLGMGRVKVTGLDNGLLRSGEIVIPEVTANGDTVIDFASYLFKGIKYIKTVKLPSGITAFPASCFQDCINLERIECKNISSLSSWCFKGCINLERIESENISSLGKECFANCTSLRFLNGEEIVKNNTLYIPQSLTYIGRRVFKGWDVEHLRIQPSDNDSELVLAGSAFGEMNNLRTAEFFRNCYCPKKPMDGISFCFFGNPNLEEIRFAKDYRATDDWYSQHPSSKPTIKEPELTTQLAVHYCDLLSSWAKVPALKKVIVENECFEPVAMDYGDAELIVNSEKFLLPHRYELILLYQETWKDEDGEIHEYEEWEYNYDWAVYWEYGALYSVSKLTIGENVKEICIDRFENLSEITVLIPEPPEWGTKFQKYIYPSATLRVPEQSVELYKNAPGWKDFYSIKPSGVEEIGTETDYVEPEYFDLTGRKVTAPEKGIYILKDSRGTRKVVF